MNVTQTSSSPITTLLLNNPLTNNGITQYMDKQIAGFWAYLLANYSMTNVTIVFPFFSLVISYVIPCLFMFVLEWLDLPFIQKYKIQKHRKNDSRLLLKATKFLIFTYFVIILPMYSIAFSFLAQLGFSLDLETPGFVSTCAQLIFYLLAEDFSHYWIHRWLHTEWAYRNIHYLHHEFTAPSSLSASYAHPLEIIAEGIGTFSGPLLIRPHFLVLFLWVNLRQASALETHSGYDFPISPNNIFSFIGGADLHDFHHRTYNGAYASNFIWWDRLFGTADSYFASKEKQRKKLLQKQQ